MKEYKEPNMYWELTGYALPNVKYQYKLCINLYQYKLCILSIWAHRRGGGEGGMNPPPWGTTDSKCQLECFVWGNMCNNTVVLLLNVFCILAFLGWMVCTKDLNSCPTAVFCLRINVLHSFELDNLFKFLVAVYLIINISHNIVHSYAMQKSIWVGNIRLKLQINVLYKCSKEVEGLCLPLKVIGSNVLCFHLGSKAVSSSYTKGLLTQGHFPPFTRAQLVN